MRKKYYCIDCNKIISIGHKRCKSCARKFEYKNPKNNPNYKNGLCIDSPKCIDCNKEIKNYYAKRCLSCAKIGKSNPNYNKRSANYIDGRSFEFYSEEFTKSLKESIRKRDNYECQNCNMTEEEHLMVIGQVLSVHHIDYNRNNCQKDNLITLCKQCNSRANINRKYWQEIYTQKIRIKINAI